MRYGTTGKILEIDLSQNMISYKYIGEDTYMKYLSGSGSAAELLLEDFNPKLDPLAPENPLLFMNGLFTGLPVPTAAKSSFIAKSPLTGIWNESTVGGHWGAQVRRCGLDGFILNGRSAKPVYLWINDDKIEIRNAENLMGMDVFETSKRIKDQTDSLAVVACIGPSGENLNAISGIMIGGSETRAAGRGGLGAILGSKNVKAIAVKGTIQPSVKNRESLKIKMRKFTPVLMKNTRLLHDYGTAGTVQSAESAGDLPVKNWSKGEWEKGAEKICGQNMEYLGITVSHHACYGCPIRCGKDARVDIGPYKGSIGHGPEYETCASFGSNLLIDDLNYIVAANDLCNRMGMDTISAGNAVAMAIECREKGILIGKDVDDIDLRWGHGEGILDLLSKMAKREGVGEIFADGVRTAGERLGGIAKEYAIHVKGLSFPFHDPRAYKSMAIGYATSNRGACHLENMSYFCESGAYIPSLLGFEKPLHIATEDNKTEINILMQNMMNVINALGLCKFILRGEVTPDIFAGWINDVTGWNLTGKDVMIAGERLHNIKRMFNVGLGISRKDDTLPPRLMYQAKETGSAKGRLPEMSKMLPEYYFLRGWSEEGIPTHEKLSQLGLEKHSI